MGRRWICMNFTKLIPKRKSDWIIVVLIGVLLMIVAIPTGSSRKEKTEEQQQETIDAILELSIVE